jgi:hypothetical protein
VRGRVAKDLAEERSKRCGGRCSEADAGFACRPDGDVDGGVEEVGDVVEAVDEGEANDCCC